MPYYVTDYMYILCEPKHVYRLCRVYGQHCICLDVRMTMGFDLDTSIYAFAVVLARIRRILLIYGRHIYHRPTHYPNRNGIHFFLLNTHRDMCVRATTPVFRLCLVTQIRTTAVHAVRHLSFLVPRQNHSMNDITSV